MEKGQFNKDCPKLKQKVLLTGEDTQGDVDLVTSHADIVADTPRSCIDFALTSCLEKLTTKSFLEGILDIWVRLIGVWGQVAGALGGHH